MSDITKILCELENGGEGVTDKLLPLVYDELRKLAAAKLVKEAPSPSLQQTMLVHEAYLRMARSGEPQTWKSKGHFFGAAAEAMRRILVENARRKQSKKHGGAMHRLDLDVESIPIENAEEELLALDEALTQFEQRWKPANSLNISCDS